MATLTIILISASLRVAYFCQCALSVINSDQNICLIKVFVFFFEKENPCSVFFHRTCPFTFFEFQIKSLFPQEALK